MELLIKEIRTELDVFSKLAKIKSINHQELLLAKAWLGEVLAKLGTISPYIKDELKHEVKDLKPTAEAVTSDTAIQMYPEYLESMNEIEQISFLRLKLKELKNRIFSLLKTQHVYNDELKKNFESAKANAESLEDKIIMDELKNSKFELIDITLEVHNSYNHITQFIFELGFLLQKIKERADGIQTV